MNGFEVYPYSDFAEYMGVKRRATESEIATIARLIEDVPGDVLLAFNRRFRPCGAAVLIVKCEVGETMPVLQ